MNNNQFPKRSENMNGQDNPRLGLFLFLAVAIIILFFYFRSNSTHITPLSYTDFINLVNDSSKKPSSVTIFDDKIIQWKIEDKIFKTIVPYHDPALLSMLEKQDVRVYGEEQPVRWTQIFIQIIPWLLGFFFLSMIIRSIQAGGPGGRGFSFGKSRAKRYEDRGKKITFADVAGQKDAKAELEEVVAFLKEPEKFAKMGARIPKGVLLVGMPGTGKTLMARAAAGEAGVAFFHMSGSDFVEMFVGVGASRVRDLFEQGRRNSPCIIFIDELDAVGRTRGAGYGGGHDEREQTLNQMLVEMDGFDSKDGVIILAATNRPDVLDPALLRPGRFDRQVTVAMPDINERAAILKIHSDKVKMAQNTDLIKIARATPGMSGADIANLVNEAALFAARKNKKEADISDFEEARDKILMGVARSTLAVSEKERKMTAYHEAGHALLHYFLPNSDPLHKVTIVPHGRSLGMAVSLPEEDSYSHTHSWLKDRITICYGGWTAEKLIFNETTTGTKQDLEYATRIARNMVCEWGMSGELGPIAFAQEDEPIFLGKEIARHKDYSEETARIIDTGIKNILDNARTRAENILSENKENLQKLACALIERETLTGEEISELLDLKKIPESNCLC